MTMLIKLRKYEFQNIVKNLNLTKLLKVKAIARQLNNRQINYVYQNNI